MHRLCLVWLASIFLCGSAFSEFAQLAPEESVSPADQLFRPGHGVEARKRRDETAQNGAPKVGGKASILTIDTRDQRTCEELTQNVGELRGKICITDPRMPFVSIIRIDPLNPNEYPALEGTEYRTELKTNIEVDEKWRKFGRYSSYGLILGVTAFTGLIYAPKSVSKWDTSDKAGFINEMPQRWKKNVRRGPVIDDDDWTMNYVGHPISGAIYYGIARHAGFGPWGSLAVSFGYSTFFWEYGVEAFAEIPSLQDLFITPLIGALMGELGYQGDQVIERNGGKIFGSRFLGFIGHVLLNPAGAVINGFESILGRPVYDHVKGEGQIVLKSVKHPAYNGEQSGFYSGFQLNFYWK